MATHPAGIIVSVADAVSRRTANKAAIAAGVPVITVDSDAPPSSRLYFIGTNNLEAGHLGGQHLLEPRHGKANSVFYSILGQPTSKSVRKGTKTHAVSLIAAKTTTPALRHLRKG